ncbi:MAG: hypothetical protein IIW88_05010 [Clostridia bacterium]|nr:hypothetical protein [Clostridia bacterium]
MNYFEFPVDEKLGVTLTDKTLQKFDVSVDMSDMQSKTLKKHPQKLFISISRRITIIP